MLVDLAGTEAYLSQFGRSHSKFLNSYVCYYCFLYSPAQEENSEADLRYSAECLFAA